MANIPTQLNNPGDLRPTDSSQPSQETASGTFREFTNPGKGFEALLNDLQSKISGKSSTGLNPKSTLADFSNVYAPESDGNNSGQYTVNLANQLKVRPDTTLGELQPRIGEFARAVANNEGYQWADQPASPTDGQNGQPGLGEQILEAGQPISDWIFKNALVPMGITAGAVGAGILSGGTAIPLEVTAGSPAATQAPGIISKIFKAGGSLLGIKGAEDIISQGINLVKGGNNQQQPQQQQSQPQDNANIQNLMSSLAPQVNASKGLYNAYQESANGLQAGRVMLQDPNMRDAFINSSVSGRGPDTSQGTMDFTQAEKERQAEANATHKLGGAVVGEGTFKTSEAAKSAEQYIPSNATPKEREAAIKHIRSEATSYGNSISLARGHEARVQQYSSAKGKYGVAQKTSAQIMAHKALARGFKESVLAHTPNKEAYKKLLKHEQDLANEKKIYKLLNGKKPPSANQFTKTLHRFGTRLFATYVGDKVGGVLGAVLGNVILNIGQKSADKRFGKNVFDSPEVRAGLKVLKEELPKQYDIFKHTLEQKGVKFPKEETEESLVKDMKKGGVTKTEKVLTHALSEPIKKIRSEMKGAKSRALNNKKKKRLSYHDRTMA